VKVVRRRLISEWSCADLYLPLCICFTSDGISISDGSKAVVGLLTGAFDSRIRARKAARRGETYTPTSKDFQGLGIEEELVEEGEVDGFAEYHTVGLPGGVAVGDDEVDERFRRVMAMEGQRGLEHEAARELGMSRQQGGLEVEVEG